jgi:hypothetical protein
MMICHFISFERKFPERHSASVVKLLKLYPEIAAFTFIGYAAIK